MKRAFLVLALLPFAFAAAIAATAAPAERQIPMKRIDGKDIPLDDLAHGFFVMESAPTALASIISAAGLERLEPELAAHKRDMSDVAKQAAKQKQMCLSLLNAATAAEFAAALGKGEQQERAEMRKAARRILSVLDPADRIALENFLNAQFRLGASRSTVDWEALFAAPNEPFPSERTTAITRTTCDLAAQMEERAARSQR